MPNLTRRIEAKLPESDGLAEEIGPIFELLAEGVVRSETHDLSRPAERTSSEDQETKNQV